MRRHHYLRTAVDRRCRPFAYVVELQGCPRGCLIFGRPEATCCFKGGLTYGSQADVRGARAVFDRWEVLNLARVWLSPDVQIGGPDCLPEVVPGYYDRHGQFRPTVASWVIRQALARVGMDYLLAHPPCFVNEPYEIRAVLSYCDTRRHKGTIYRAAGFSLARTNTEGIQTWWTSAVAPLDREGHFAVECASERCPRAQRIRAQRAQGTLALAGEGVSR